MKAETRMVPAAKTPVSAIAQRNVVVRKNSGRRTQGEPNSADGVNEGQLFRQIDLSPEPADVNIDQVGARIEVIVPDLLEEHCARHHLPVVTHQLLEQP